MNSKTPFFKIMLIVGLILLFLSFLLRNPMLYDVFPAEFILSNKYNVLCGMLFGLGGGVTCISSLYIFTYSENPRRMYSADKRERKQELELKDKKLRAQAAAGAITNWAVLSFAYILLMLNMPMWTVVGALIIFGLNYGVWFFYLRK